MLVNNEIGVIQDVQAIGRLCREKGVIFHVDAAQATGKVAIDVKTLHAKIGELTLENDFLSGALGKAGLLSAKR